MIFGPFLMAFTMMPISATSKTVKRSRNRKKVVWTADVDKLEIDALAGRIS